ncbi:MAG TPA: MFS transporter [Candidatus Omnitrophota bacterium]|nr:MFS transporter [Candidatus Omnitrophota bacterium]
MSDKARAIALIALCEVMTLSLWFSATAVLPELKAQGGLDSFHASLFTSLVAVGFVCGTLTSALLGLADRWELHHFFRAAAWVAALANLGLLVFEPASPMVLACRFVTGFCMAGVYPVGMKMVSTWAKGDMGLLVGLLVGALTLGSGSPHLFNALGGLDWRLTVALASGSAAVAGLLIGGARLGPNLAKAPPFQPGYVLEAWRNKPLRLANFGYLGHQWELYAMWAWLGAFLQASFAEQGVGTAWANAATFAVIGLGGAIGCLAGGLLADRWGRTTITMAAMAASGTCALLAGLVFGAHPGLVMAVCVVWGVTVVADSAQFSSSIIELSERSHIGTMLTTQTCVGFLLTLVTIHLVPLLVAQVGWRWAFAGLAAGPYLGVVAMGALRRRPEAVKLAGGRR